MADVFDHCADLVRGCDKDRFLATLFAPADRRGPLFALYAFDAEIAAVRERVRGGFAGPMAGEIRLQWWRDVLAGERRGEAAANPVAAALSETLARFSLPAWRLIDLVEAHAFDLYDDPMPSLGALEGYARHTAVTVCELAVLICGAPAQEASERAGLACGITALLRAFALHASRRQLFVPAEMLGDATPEEIFAGRSSPGLRDALALLRARTREHVAAFEQAPLPATAIAALLPAALVPGTLRLMERPDYDPFRTAVELPQWRRQWTLWRAARRYARRAR